MLQEIANQKGVSCRAQGWKVHLCAAQLLQLVGEGDSPATYSTGEHRSCVRQGVFTNSVHAHLTLGYHKLVCSAQREWDALSPFSGMWHKWLGNLVLILLQT